MAKKQKPRKRKANKANLRRLARKKKLNRNKNK
jgi:hypothetical protein